MLTLHTLLKLSDADSEHPADRRSRAVDAAERCADASDYELFGIQCAIDRAAEGISRAKTGRARLRLHGLVYALHDILMRGEA